MSRQYKEIKLKVKSLLKRGISRERVMKLAGLSTSSMRYCMYLIELEQQGQRPIDEKNEWARDRGYNSYTDYQRNLIKSRGDTYQKARERRIKNKRMKSAREYDDFMAHKAGFDSHKQRTAYRVSERQRKPENKELSELIRRKLLESGKPQSWLAEKIGVSRQEVSYYAQAKAFPMNGKLERLLGVLSIDLTYLRGSYPNLARHLDY